MNKMILTAGPSITGKEISYVVDAITNGVDEHWGDYIERFENAFARYIGVKHAMATSSCTGALHLALVALGVGKGHEVIIPDMSWVATASAICYTGAKPVFADVLPFTWCIDPMDIQNRITPRTKVILPVHLYGQPAAMDEIKAIALGCNLWVVEDAAPSIGAAIDGFHTGNLGDIGCFSFQGAKTLSTGEGGMIVTSNDELFEKIKYYANHCRLSSGFEIGGIGFKYKMSNLQAALGLAQLERVEELVARKREIYSWYCEELDEIEGLLFNAGFTPKVEPSYWMTSIVLEKEFRVSRDVLMRKLKDKNIDTRPFFPPISSFKMFTPAKNYVANFLGENGINLPSGHRITREQVKYVCDCIKDILKV